MMNLLVVAKINKKSYNKITGDKFMGMFDYIEVDKSIKLPVFKEFRSLKIDPHSLDLQTKSLEKTLSNYEIKKDKKLYLNGDKINYHGIIDFGAYHVTDTVDYLLDYEAKFTDGMLKSIKLKDHRVIEHESNKVKHERLFENLKNRNNRPLLRFFLFIERVLVLYPLNFIGFNFKQSMLGTLSGSNFLLTFYCPKLVLGYKKDYKYKSYGFSIENIDTQIVFNKTEYSSEFLFKILGFGFCSSTYKKAKFT